MSSKILEKVWNVTNTSARESVTSYSLPFPFRLLIKSFVWWGTCHKKSPAFGGAFYLITDYYWLLIISLGTTLFRGGSVCEEIIQQINHIRYIHYLITISLPIDIEPRSLKPVHNPMQHEIGCGKIFSLIQLPVPVYPLKSKKTTLYFP
jgi:hypothetical protein